MLGIISSGDKKKQLEIAHKVLDIPMDWFEGFHSLLPEQHTPVNRLRWLYNQIVQEDIPLEKALSNLQVSWPIYRSRSICFWYFGILPDYMLWYYFRHVFMSPVFLKHTIRSGYLMRLMSMIFRRQHDTYSVPALVVDGTNRTSIEDPEETRGLPGFGLENILTRDRWLVYPYGLLLIVS